MSYHVRSHQGGVEKPYVCPHCAKGFSRYDMNLCTHQKNKLVTKTRFIYECTEIMSTYIFMISFYKHMHAWYKREQAVIGFQQWALYCSSDSGGGLNVVISLKAMERCPNF